MKKKILTLTVLVLGAISNAQAGGLMTNTNYHIAFDRMMARGATFDIDAAYSNPAGMAWTKEGWQLSLNFQKPWQNRDIKLSFSNPYGDFFEKTYEGKASAPIVPALFASYKHDRWAHRGQWRLRRIQGGCASVQHHGGIRLGGYHTPAQPTARNRRSWRLHP